MTATRRSLIAFALVTSTISALSPHRGAAGDSPPRADEVRRVFLTGAAKLNVKGVAKSAAVESLRFEYAGATFTATPLGGAPRSGSHVAKGRTGASLTCTLDASGLDALEASIADRVSAGLDGNPPVAVTVERQKMKVVLGATRASRKLSSKFTIRVSVDGGPASRGSFRHSGNAVPRRVLVLDDEEAGPAVREALTAARHVPVDGGNYFDWDGATPSLADAEVVFFLQGESYYETLRPAADDALVAFVQGGGGLVRTEWGAYEAGDSPSQAIDALLPVVSPDSDYDYGSTWAVDDRRHPLARGLPKAPFAVPDAGASFVQPISGATVVVTLTTDGYGSFPAVTFAQFGAGTVVHVNHDLTYTVDVVPREVMTILLNAAAFTAP